MLTCKITAWLTFLAVLLAAWAAHKLVIIPVLAWLARRKQQKMKVPVQRHISESSPKIRSQSVSAVQSSQSGITNCYGNYTSCLQNNDTAMCYDSLASCLAKT